MSILMHFRNRRNRQCQQSPEYTENPSTNISATETTSSSLVSPFLRRHIDHQRSSLSIANAGNSQQLCRLKSKQHRTQRRYRRYVSQLQPPVVPHLRHIVISGSLINMLQDIANAMPYTNPSYVLLCLENIEKQIQQQDSLIEKHIYVGLINTDLGIERCRQENNNSMLSTKLYQREYSVPAGINIPYCHDSDCLKILTTNSSTSEWNIPQELINELSGLYEKYKINVNKIQNNLNSITVICDMSDDNLPNIPDLRIEILPGYPYTCPQLVYGTNEYAGSEFLQSLKINLIKGVMELPQTYCLTLLLSVWKMAVCRTLAPQTSDLFFALNDIDLNSDEYDAG